MGGNHCVKHIHEPFTYSDRSQVLGRFSKIVTAELGNAMSNGTLRGAWAQQQPSGAFAWLFTDYSTCNSGSATRNPRDYADERGLLQTHATPFIWGVGCTVATLASLRFGRWREAKHLVSVNQGYRRTANPTSSGTPPFLKDARRSGHATPHSTSLSSSRKEEEMRKLSADLVTIPVDLALSILVGLSSAAFLSEPEEVARDMSRTPLLRKSVIAETLCLPFCHEKRTIDSSFKTYDVKDGRDHSAPSRRQVVPMSEIWTDANTQDFESLRAIRNFVSNCQAREEAAREQAADADVMSAQDLIEFKLERNLKSI